MKIDIGDKLHNNLSRVAMVVWLFVALIIMQTYTANLTSMLTVERLEPTISDVDQLRNNNIMVGYSTGSFLKNYLHDVLHFNPANIRQFRSHEEFAEALRRKEIGAIFIEAPGAKIFLAKYCKEFIQAGSMYKIGGFGFAFPNGSPYLPLVNRALLDLFESGKQRELENRMLASEKCEESQPDGETASLSPNSFWALFTLTAGTSTIALLIYVTGTNYSNHDHRRRIQRITTVVTERWGQAKKRLSKKDSQVVVECPVDSPDSSSHGAMQPPHASSTIFITSNECEQNYGVDKVNHG
ncbi:hypothetical protein PIB30_025449 [Stylosanthes scabra]|uniref:Ionotropic glutamate receptor C-terminal domain-containing protein n=1 Tax=Stylosanthes scabra TaxID=79078 RepID=A0ABU6U9I3_9FABA|nr:hypothetical protein [Stylosanthes scabra]